MKINETNIKSTTNITIVNGTKIKMYEEIKEGIKTDVNDLGISLYGGVGYISLLLTIFTIYFITFGSYFHNPPEIKLLIGLPLTIIVLGMIFSKRFGNKIVDIWFYIFGIAIIIGLSIIGIYVLYTLWSQLL